MKPNEQQTLSFVRDLMQIVGTFLVTSHLFGVTDQFWQLLTGVVLMAVPFIWGAINHTQANAVAVVAALDKTTVSPDGRTITLQDPNLRNAAAGAATPH